MKRAVTFLFRLEGGRPLSEKEFVQFASYRLNWFKPTEAQRLLRVAQDLKVVERFTAIDRNTINYEATMTDPKVFLRPWKISMPLYRRIDKGMQLLEFKCVEFVEELMYGHLRKQPSNP